VTLPTIDEPDLGSPQNLHERLAFIVVADGTTTVRRSELGFGDGHPRCRMPVRIHTASADRYQTSARRRNDNDGEAHSAIFRSR